MNQNKTGKYFKYAIGEIALVIIGILIALQINNWNIEKGTHFKQESHLELIRVEMTNNLNSISKEIIKLNKTIESQQKVITLIDSDSKLDSISEQELSNLFVSVLANEISVDYEDGALTELIGTGGLKDIENDSIRGVLASWEGKMEILRSQEKSFREYWVKSNDYFLANGSFRTIFDNSGYNEYVEIAKSSKTNSNKELVRSIEFENILLIYLATSIHLDKNIYPKYLKDIQGLIDLLN